MKKVISLILIAMTLFCCAINSFAAVPEQIVPMWNNISMMTNNLYFDGTEGDVSATVVGKLGTTQIVGSLIVYKQVSSGWKLVGQESATSSTQTLNINFPFDAVSGGYYKSVFTVTVTINGVNESETKTSYKTCPSTN